MENTVFSFISLAEKVFFNNNLLKHKLENKLFIRNKVKQKKRKWNVPQTIVNEQVLNTLPFKINIF